MSLWLLALMLLLDGADWMWDEDDVGPLMVGVDEETAASMADVDVE